MMESGIKYSDEEIMEMAWERYNAGIEFEKIEKDLICKCKCGEERMKMILQPIKTAHYKKSRKTGTQCLAIGFTMILFGFVITCSNFHTNQPVTWAMYGLTTMGLMMVFYGLYKIMA